MAVFRNRRLEWSKSLCYWCECYWMAKSFIIPEFDSYLRTGSSCLKRPQLGNFKKNKLQFHGPVTGKVVNHQCIEVQCMFIEEIAGEREGKKQRLHLFTCSIFFDKSQNSILPTSTNRSSICAIELGETEVLKGKIEKNQGLLVVTAISMVGSSQFFPTPVFPENDFGSDNQFVDFMQKHKFKIYFTKHMFYIHTHS